MENQLGSATKTKVNSQQTNDHPCSRPQSTVKIKSQQTIGTERRHSHYDPSTCNQKPQSTGAHHRLMGHD
jgi:hypothetical protein